MDKIHKIQPYLPYQLMLLRTAVQVQKSRLLIKDWISMLGIVDVLKNLPMPVR